MTNIKAIIRYKGTNYYGFQKQPNYPTIQEEVEKVLGTILREDIQVIGASRTDAGVHALGQVINFRTDSLSFHSSLSRLKWAANSLLPKDIKISFLEEVDESFDARRHAQWKEYSYYILNQRYPSVFFDKMCTWVGQELDLDAVNKASEFLVGRYNFAAFSRLDGMEDSESNPTRTILLIDCEHSSDFFGIEEKNLIKIKIRANSFLYNMARIIVGTLIEVGSGKYPPSKVRRILESQDRTKAGPTAAAKGLFLNKVCY